MKEKISNAMKTASEFIKDRVEFVKENKISVAVIYVLGVLSAWVVLG